MNPIPNKIPTVTLNINGQEVKGHPLSAIIDTSWAVDSNLEKLTLTIILSNLTCMRQPKI